MNLIYGCFILMILSMEYLSTRGKTFWVSDYGAYPDDDLDDTIAIQSAINDAIDYKLMSDIVFGYGIYAISSSISIYNAANLTITGQGIDQTFLIGHFQGIMLFTQLGQGIKLTSFSIDYDPLPFTAGYVVDVNEKYLDLQVVPPHQTDVGQQVHGILRYDPLQMRPAFGPNTYEIYQQPSPTDPNTTIVSPGVVRLPLSSPTRFLKGDPIVARYDFINPAIYAQDVYDLTFQSIVIYTSWGMGFVAVRTHRLNINNCHVIPRNERWMSTIIDCMHFTDARESISISDSSCHGTGDDGLNVHAVFLLVPEVINSTTIIIQAMKYLGSINMGVGTNLEFSSH